MHFRESERGSSGRFSQTTLVARQINFNAYYTLSNATPTAKHFENIERRQWLP